MRPHLSDNAPAPHVLGGQRNAAPEPFQTFSLDIGNGARIKVLLLDRFLACMKPASITERRPRAGVFFGQKANGGPIAS
jgi:hypothetical protein